MNAHPLPHLLTAAAHLLEKAGELPPLTVALTPDAGLMPPVTLSPAANLPVEDQHTLVHASPALTDGRPSGSAWPTDGAPKAPWAGSASR